jgi:DNA polymerase (family 10)
MDKAAIVEVLEEIAELLELKGENAFKVRAYQNGARALETLDEDLGTVIAEERLGEVKGSARKRSKSSTTRLGSRASSNWPRPAGRGR